MTFPLLAALKSMTSASSPVSGPGAEITTSDGRALPLRGITLRITARGGIARAVLEQRYVNPHDEILNVTYRMPLPADGAVSLYQFDIGDRRIAGVVDRKAAAREKFERAIASGHTAAILEQERADIFTQQIGNVPPRETIVARIGVDMKLAWLPEGEWELRFPTVIGPRYISAIADTGADAAATKVDTVVGTGLALGLQVTIADELADGRKPSSPTHTLKTIDGGVALDAAKLDRDIVIRWPVATAKIGMSVAVARPGAAEQAYGLVTIVPPSAATNAKSVKRDLLVLLDTSGSMGGAPLDKAQQVLPLVIESLGEGDRLEMIEFSNSPRRYKDAPVEVTAKEKAEAIKWIRSRRADGGTEMRAAIIEALSTLRLGAQRQVVVVTDGYVGGEQQILEVLHAKLPKSCRLHVIGVGSAVNRSLAAALARAGRGVEILVGPDEDAERGAKRLLDRTKAPVLTNLELAGTALVRHVPEHLPDVFAGAPLVGAIEVKAAGGTLVVRGEIAGDTWEQRIVVPATAAGEGDQAVVALFGREHVADLESRNAMKFGEYDAQIEATGVAFQIATRLTSWVAVDESRVVTGRTRDESIPQELPYGTHAASFGVRSGSSGLAAQFDDVDEEIALGGAPMLQQQMPAQPRLVQPSPAKTVMALEKSLGLRSGGVEDKKEAAEAKRPRPSTGHAQLSARPPKDVAPGAPASYPVASQPQMLPASVEPRYKTPRNKVRIAIAFAILAALIAAIIAILWALLA